MRLTVRNSPGTIGVAAVFAEAPGQWVDTGNTYEKTSDEGTTVFMRQVSLYLNRYQEEELTLLDVDSVALSTREIFATNPTNLSKEDFKLFTIEQGAANVDFDVTIEDAVQKYKDKTLEDYMGRIDKQVETLFSRSGIRDIGALAYAVERYFSRQENLESVSSLRDRVFEAKFSN